VEFEIKSMEYNLLYKCWKDLVDISPRFMGTVAEKKAIDYIAEKLTELDVNPVLQSFDYNSWELLGEIELRMVAPRPLNFKASALLGSGSTSIEKLSGKLVLLGETVVWDMYEWKRFGVLNDLNEIVGYISGRPDGEAISQTLAGGNSPLPHFVIGEQDSKLIIDYLENGHEVLIEGTLNTKSGNIMQGKNICTIFPSKSNQEKIIICAHYDTMFNTPGAYDNTSGVAILIQLVESLKQFNLEKTLEIVFMGAEEWNLAGSKSYVKNLDENERNNISLVINVDGIGRGNRLEAWVGPEKQEGDIFNFFHNEIKKDIYVKCPPPPGSDHTPFYDVGIPVCMFTINDQPIIHSEHDVLLEDIYRNMEMFTKVLIEFLIYKNVISNK
jgi:hypothetical protein